MKRYLILFLILISFFFLIYCNVFIYKTIAEKIGLIISIGIGWGTGDLIWRWKEWG